MILVCCIILLLSDRITNVEEVSTQQSAANDVDSLSLQLMQVPSQSSLVDSQSTVPDQSVKQETPRPQKKRKAESKLDDQLATALIKSLGTTQTLTPLGQSVSNLEHELNKLGQKRLLLELSREVNKVINEVQEKSISLLENVDE